MRRECHGSVGEVKVADHPGALFRLFARGEKLLNLAVGAVLIGQSLPVVIDIFLRSMIKLVVVEAERLMSGEAINARKVRGPGNFRLQLGIHVDPDKASLVDMNMKREQSVLLLIEALQVLILGSLCQLTVETIRPSMILARQDTGCSVVLGDDREGSVPANVVETSDNTLVVSDKEEVEASLLVADIGTTLGKSNFVSE